MIGKIIEDLNLDTEEDLQIYMSAYSSFEVCGHRVTIGICKDGDTGFTVDGACDYDSSSMNAIKGGLILRRLLKEWKILIKDLRVTPFCYPTETDGLANKRVKMFRFAGFSMPDSEGKMIYEKSEGLKPRPLWAK